MVVPTVDGTGVATSSMMKSRLAAEAWDAKGLACPTRDYEDAALRLKNGSCEDDEPSQGFRIAVPREGGEHGRLDRERHWPGDLNEARVNPRAAG